MMRATLDRIGRFGRLLAVLAGVGAVTMTATFALAAGTAYALHVSVPSSVEQKTAFTVVATGHAKRAATLVIFLDHRKCATSESSEYQQDKSGQYQPSYPYFEQKAGGKVTRTVLKFYVLAPGNFSKTPRAHAGWRTGTEHVCAYLVNGPENSMQRRRVSLTYTVTK